MGTRKNQASLSDTERQAFINAVKTLKRTGVYDAFVLQHRDVILGSQSAAHMGPGFLPWHREFLLQFELKLQEVDSSVTLPYWDWTDTFADHSPWKENLLGGNGDFNKNYKVVDGPFAYDKGEWNLNVFDDWPPLNAKPPYPPRPPGDDPFLKRSFGLNDTTLPALNDVNDVLQNCFFYDSPPWNETPGSYPAPPTTVGLRKSMESRLHNRAHDYVGGSMVSLSSPNDPAFWLHHCNVDRLWALWQSKFFGLPYLPPSGTSAVWPGHCLDDSMPPWDGGSFPPTPHSVLDHRALGYEYDTDVTNPPNAAVSWQMGAHCRAYECRANTVSEQRLDDGVVRDWQPIVSGQRTVSGQRVAAVTWPGVDPADQPVLIYVLDGAIIRELYWAGNVTPRWDQYMTFDMTGPTIASLAAVSWDNGRRRCVYIGIGSMTAQYYFDGNSWTAREIAIPDQLMVSAISWVDSNGFLHIRLHALGDNGKISVWTSSDGRSYQRGQFP